MYGYLIRRLLLVPVTVLGLTLLIFSITRFLPGGPLDRHLAQEMTQANAIALPTLSDEQLAGLKQYYGMDQPLFKAYGAWLTALMQGNLGTSLRYQEPVWTLMQQRLPVSLLFGVASLFCSYGLCIGLGLLCAYRPENLMVRGLQGLLLIFNAIPSSIMAMLLFFLVAANGYFPLGGLTSEGFTDLNAWEKFQDLLAHATLPLIAYCAHNLAVLTFILKDSLRDELAGEAVRMARAKGASAAEALLFHALPLAILPIISQIGHQISLVLAGSFLIERIFNLNGFGLLSFEALHERDYPLVIGLLTVAGLLHIIGNLLSDFCLSWADPRIRLTRGER
ncbi:MAG TPA: ABC transporter permease [Oligoflexus sp.]|uniref:ABC transporter permease n=1 Tax=Oligoflexus sp. TaxID=1971216 RepID=UPI002D687096|nr:ABC transporter permease [Oligoflexus sp.]HYX38629.1 ABC transporter permease [Oligoflexus sp.]